METQTQVSLLNLEARIRRSKGRTGRTISATAKVTRDEQNEMEAAAKQKGQSLSEWCRDVLLAAARGEADWPHNVYKVYWPISRADSFAPAAAEVRPGGLKVPLPTIGEVQAPLDLVI